jgi:pheromone a factor receptor
MRSPEFPVFCMLAILLCLTSLPWHWKARNTGTLLYLGWTLVGCTVFLINSLVWAGNLHNPAPIWCDICKQARLKWFKHSINILVPATRLIVGLSIGVTASSLCINRQLYHAATVKSVSAFRDSVSTIA